MFQQSPSTSRSQAGFTLVEVALSATVMLFVIAGMLSAVTSSSQMLDTSQRMVVANNLITNHVADLRQAGWDSVAALPGSSTLTPPARFTTVAKGMTLTRTVVDEDTDLRRVTVSVDWVGLTGRNHNATQSALFSKNGLSASYGF